MEPQYHRNVELGDAGVQHSDAASRRPGRPPDAYSYFDVLGTCDADLNPLFRFAQYAAAARTCPTLRQKASGDVNSGNVNYPTTGQTKGPPGVRPIGR